MSHERRWKNAAFCTILTALLMAPHLFTGTPAWPYPVFGPARVLSDDEPHYLLLINSFLEGHGFNLADDYAAVHAGGQQAGEFYSGWRTLDHHTILLIDGRPREWSQFYAIADEQWAIDEAGVVHPTLKTPGVAPPPGAPEYSIHQYGVGFLLAPVLWPFRGTTWLEPAALFCSGLAVVGAMLLYRMLLRCFSADDFTVNAVTVVAFLGSPVWFYGRSLFLEGLLTFCAVGAYALALRKKWSFLPGILVGISLQLKAHEALVGLPLLADVLLRREWRRAVWMALPIAGSAAVLLGLNAMLYGSPLTPPQPFVPVNPWDGFTGLLFSSQWGLFLFCPVAALALVCWLTFLRRHGRPAVVMASGFVLYFLLMMCYAGWHGSYGPRHLVPALPLLLAGLAALPEMRMVRSAVVKVLAGGLTALSVVINGFGVFCYSQFWERNPFREILVLLHLWPQ